MVDRRKLRHRIGAAQRIGDRQPHHRHQALALLLADRQHRAARRHMRLEARRQRQPRLRPQNRGRAVRAAVMRKRSRHVDGVRVVAGAARIAARKRVVVQLHQRVLVHNRRVVVDIDRQRAPHNVSILVGNLIADDEGDVVFVAARRMMNGSEQCKRIVARNRIGEVDPDDCLAVLADDDPQPAGADLIGEAAVGRQFDVRQQQAAGTVDIIVMRKHARQRRRAVIVENAADIAAWQRIVVERGGRTVRTGSRMRIREHIEILRAALTCRIQCRVVEQRRKAWCRRRGMLATVVEIAAGA